MPNRTPLYEMHLKHHALMVNFAGWEMPLHYGSQIEEHHQVRRDAGMFDVSHMGILDIEGQGAQAFLRYLLANNIDKLKTPGKALYSCLLNIEGGVLDDLIVYYISSTLYRLVVNAATRAKDLEWIKKISVDFAVKVTQRSDLAMIAIQGPKSLEKVGLALPAQQEKLKTLKPFHFFQSGAYFIAKTGYTGEDGVEIIVSAAVAKLLWQQLFEQGIYPIGLGARDTLRLEAGYNLYGQDMDETVTPLESNLAWTVAFEPADRLFIGREALEMQQREGISRKLIGVKLLDKGVLRHHQAVIHANQKVGEITSGTFSPTLKHSIGLARVQAQVDTECMVDIRGQHLRAQIVQPPFV